MIYKTKDIELNELPKIAICLQKFPSTWFILGGVYLQEINDTLKLSFEYDIIEGQLPDDVKLFEKSVGDFIVWYMTNNQEQLIYKGGIDGS